MNVTGECGRRREYHVWFTVLFNRCSYLQVVESCSWVYLDGTESRGSSSVTVIAKYGRHTKFLFFQVWMPEIPLEVTLSDPLLSHVKGWKVPNQSSNPRLACS